MAQYKVMLILVVVEEVGGLLQYKIIVLQNVKHGCDNINDTLGNRVIIVQNVLSNLLLLHA